MRRRRQNDRITVRAIAAAAGALAGAAAAGAMWWRDARRRARRAARIQRAQVDLLLNTLSAGDRVTAEHCRRVANLTDVLGASLGLSGSDRTRLRLASLLHDMGKIDDRFFHIIHSRDRLDADQREAIRQHPYQSAHILAPLERTHPGITRIVESHHECWDGNGYPRGLHGTQIPLEARIISVADVFDALTQPRAYRAPLSVEEALHEICDEAGTKFDPAVAEQLNRPEVVRRWTRITNRGHLHHRPDQQAEKRGEE